jgi:hypothetical protein
MKKIIMLSFTLIFIFSCWRQESKLEKALYGTWDIGYFSRNHEFGMYGFDNKFIALKSKWKVLKADESTNTLKVLFYNGEITEEAKENYRRNSGGKELPKIQNNKFIWIIKFNSKYNYMIIKDELGRKIGYCNLKNPG